MSSQWFLRQIMRNCHLALTEKDHFKLSRGSWGYSGTFFITVTSIIIPMGCKWQGIGSRGAAKKGGKKRVNTTEGTARSKNRGGRGGPQQSRIPHCSPWRTPHCSRWIFPGENCDLWSAHARAREKCEEKGAAERNCYGLAIVPCTPAPLGWGGWVGESGLKECS